MSNMQKVANERLTAEDMAKTKKGKAARSIGEVEVAADEKKADEPRTTAPTVGAQAVLVAVEERKEADEAIATMLDSIERRERPPATCQFAPICFVCCPKNRGRQCSHFNWKPMPHLGNSQDPSRQPRKHRR